jgi:hypothetical protein
MTYHKAKLEGGGDRASAGFKPVVIRKLSETNLRIQSLLFVSVTGL